MGMGAKYRYVKHLSCKNAGSTDTASDHSSTGTKDTGIRSLGTAKTKFHNAVTLGCIAYTGCLCCNQTLVIDDVQDGSLNKLGFHDRCDDFYHRLSWEDHSSFRDSIDIACEMEVA